MKNFKKQALVWLKSRYLWPLGLIGAGMSIYGVYMVGTGLAETLSIYKPAFPLGPIAVIIGLLCLIASVGIFGRIKPIITILIAACFVFWAISLVLSWSLAGHNNVLSTPTWSGILGELFLVLPFLIGVILVFYVWLFDNPKMRPTARMKITLSILCTVLILMPFVGAGVRYIQDRTGHNMGPDFVFVYYFADIGMDLNIQHFTYATDFSPDDFLKKYPEIGTRGDATTVYFDDTEISGMYANFCKLSDNSCRHKLDEMHPLDKVVYEKKYLVTFDSEFAYQKMAETVGASARSGH